MEVGLELRPQPDVDRTRRPYRGLYGVAEMAFVRASSQCLPNRRGSHRPPRHAPYPGRATPATPPASVEAESQNESQTQAQTKIKKTNRFKNVVAPRAGNWSGRSGGQAGITKRRCPFLGQGATQIRL